MTPLSLKWSFRFYRARLYGESTVCTYVHYLQYKICIKVEIFVTSFRFESIIYNLNLYYSIICFLFFKLIFTANISHMFDYLYLSKEQIKEAVVFYPLHSIFQLEGTRSTLYMKYCIIWSTSTVLIPFISYSLILLINILLIVNIN